MEQPRSASPELFSFHRKLFLLAAFLAAALAFPLAAWSDNAPFVADSSTIALYHFDTGAAGDELKDASPNALNLAASGNVQFLSNNLAWMSSPSGTVVHFSGPADKLTVAIPDNLLMPNAAGQITPSPSRRASTSTLSTPKARARRLFRCTRISIRS